jgi:hypothetical protein
MLCDGPTPSLKNPTAFSIRGSGPRKYIEGEEEKHLEHREVLPSWCVFYQEKKKRRSINVTKCVQ